MGELSLEFQSHPLKTMEGLTLLSVDRNEDCHNFSLVFDDKTGMLCNCLYQILPGVIGLDDLVGATVVTVDDREPTGVNIHFSNQALLILDCITPDGYDTWAPEKLIYDNNHFEPPLLVVVTRDDFSDIAEQ